jgi:glycosyltransferase involved in cell wall biosynthesis
MTKKRVLIYSIAYYPYVGGAEAAVREITDRIDDVEWHMVTCLFDTKLAREEKIGNVTVYRVGGPKILSPFIGFWKGVQLQGKNNYQIVWSIMTFAGFAGLFLKLFFPEIKFLLTLQEGTPIGEIKRKAAIVYPLFWLMFKKADKVQAISHFLAGFGRDMGHTKEIDVVANGVDLKYFANTPQESDLLALKKKFGKKEGDIFMISTSRLVKKNAMDDCIQALKYLPEHVSLLIVGVGDEEQKLRTLARDIGMRDRVKFLGFLPKEEIPKLLAVSDVFVRPSRSEGFGNSFIEAMASGLPVVATPVGGIPDFLDDHETGVFCRPDNPKSLAEAVMEIIDNPALREKIIRQGKERAITRYGWDVIVKDMKEKVFEPLLR